MSALEQEDPFQHFESDVIKALNVYDESRNHLYDWLSSLAVEPPDMSEYHEETVEYISNTARAFTDLVTQLHHANDDIDSAKEQIVKVWQDDDTDRTSTLNGLLGCECVEGFEGDEVQNVVNDVYMTSDDEKALSENIYVIYRQCVAGDVQTYAEHLQGKKEQLAQEGRDNSPETVGTHHDIDIEIDLPLVTKQIVDVGKIALGVALGIIISKRFKR